MSLFLSALVSSRPLAGDGTEPPVPGEILPLPIPMPIAPGEPAPNGRLRMVVGTEADETLVIEGGATAIGGGGDDAFVLVSSGVGEGAERLGAVLDFTAGDTLDLSRLGANARVLGREALDGGARVSIDYDGDGQEDGFVLTFEKAVVSPEPDDGGVTILPFPLPVDVGGGIGDGAPLPVDLGGGIGDGEFHILPYPLPGDGEFHILPYPMPGDGEVSILPALDLGAGGWAAF